jgi:uncharacterized membrane protein HdeD (DUF308 family)
MHKACNGGKMSTKEYVDGSHHGLVVTQGLVAVAFGVVALFFPGLTLANLVTLFAVFLVVVGVTELVHGLRDLGKTGSYWFSLVVGAVLLASGVFLVRNPVADLSAFVVFAGALVLARGVADLFVSAFYSDKSEFRTLWVVSGVVGVVAGILLWRSSSSMGLDAVGVLGLYALVVGSVSLAVASRVRG